MKAYWNDGRGRYATGESYEYFYMEEYEEAYKTLFTSSDGLWTYVEGEDGIELARYNGNELHLKSVTIPKSVTMSDEAFSDCEALKHVELEEGIQKLNEYAFFHCTALKELKIPESVMEFGEKSVGIMETREYVNMGAYRIKGYQTVPSFQIRGIPGSAAEQYANEHKISFIEDRTL